MQNKQYQYKFTRLLNNFVNLHIFSLIDVGNFEVWMCKIEQFFYFSFYDVNALIRKRFQKLEKRKKKGGGGGASLL